MTIIVFCDLKHFTEHNIIDCAMEPTVVVLIITARGKASCPLNRRLQQQQQQQSRRRRSSHLTEFSQKWATVSVTSAACTEVWYGLGAAGS